MATPWDRIAAFIWLPGPGPAFTFCLPRIKAPVALIELSRVGDPIIR